MKKTIIYFGMALMVFSNFSFAANSRSIGNLQAVHRSAAAPSPIVVAISKGEIETVKKFIEYGADVNEKCNGMTPLMYAARYNKGEIIKYLLLKGADRNLEDSQGFTALKHAELSNAYDAIAILKSSALNERVKISFIDDTSFLNPDSVLSLKSVKTIDEIMVADEKIIESTDTDEVQPLNFTEINKKFVVKNEINS